MKHSKKCNICSARLLNYKTYLKWSVCYHSSHPKCNFLTKTDADELMLNSDWMCNTCTADTFPLINDAVPHYNVKIDTYSQNNCHSCSKEIGKKNVKCDMCNNNIHRCCKLDNFGCKKCRDDIFPAWTDLFSNNINSLFFILTILVVQKTK